MSLYIDITELVSWKGKLTGVPRVMNELSFRFAESDKAIFVKWEGLSRSFIEADFPLMVGAEAELSLPQTEKAMLARRIIRKIAYSNRVSGMLAGNLKKVRKGKSRNHDNSRAAAAILPKKGDTLLILADWHGADENFVGHVLNLKSRGIKLIQVCYDMLPVVTPQYSGHSTNTFKNYVEKIYPLCDLILAISEHTKKDIGLWLKSRKLRVPRVETFRLGDDFKQSKPLKPDDAKFAALLKKNKEFILCVGTIEARKNHTLLYYAYKLARLKNIKLPPIIIAGRRGWKSDDIYDIINTDPETQNSILFLENRSDEELAWLYKNCLFTVYPSFYEGWGLPIAESISYGTPCVSSNTSSMPEVAGELIEYFSPASSDECLAAITNLLNGTNLSAAKVKLEEYKPTSWDSTFEEVENYIRKVAG